MERFELRNESAVLDATHEGDLALAPLAAPVDSGGTSGRSQDSAPASPARRGLLKAAAAAPAALVIGFTLPVASRRAEAAPAGTTVNGRIVIAADETVTMLIGATEMGQGILTGLAQALADELRVDWARVRAEHAPSGAGFGNPLFGGMRLTGGSTSMRGYYAALRKVGAAAREMLVNGAATLWNVDPTACTADAGRVTLNGTTQSLTYGQLAPAAAMLAVPTAPATTPEAQLKYIGRRMARTDIPSKVDGSAVYGIDVRLPGMVYAAIRHCPVVGGTLASTPSRPAGALAVVPLGNAVAVVAGDTWSAMRLVRGLNVQWKYPADQSALNSANFVAQANAMLASGTLLPVEVVGDVAAGMAAAKQAIDATYTLPYLAHACMEVLNCTVSLTATSCEIWAPTQGQDMVVGTAKTLTGLPATAIRVNTTMLGGGLGRKIEQDYIAEAIRIAQAVGKPVKLTWSREEDFRKDVYRPMAVVRVKAGIDAAGNVSAWTYRHVSPSITGQRRPLTGVDGQASEGSDKLPYALPARRIEWGALNVPVPVGYWRSVGHSINAFVVESAIDELALASGQDPYVFRRRLMTGNARALAVLDAVAELAGWSTAVPTGRARGIAFAESFGSLCAQVVEVSATSVGGVKVHKVACAIDCGFAVNPDAVEAQMQGGIVHGLASALWGQVPFSLGAPTVSNFNRYRMLRLAEMPVVSVRIVNSGAALGGVGEPGVPPIAPAVANAWARLTGMRVRNLPMFPAQGTMGE